MPCRRRSVSFTAPAWSSTASASRSSPTARVRPTDIEAARKALAEASDKLEPDRANLRRVQGLPLMPLPTRLEAGLATSRAELALVETAIERTRIRAPIDGTVLQVNTRVGETVTPSTEDVLVTIGDLAQLRVRAEIEERDIAKIRVGQTVMVRSDAFPGQEFAGKVERMAQTLGPSRIASKGPRRPSDVESAAGPDRPRRPSAAAAGHARRRVLPP